MAGSAAAARSAAGTGAGRAAGGRGRRHRAAAGPAGRGQRRDADRQLSRRGAPAVRARGHDRRRGPGNHSAGGRGTPWPVVHRGSRAHVHQPHRPGRPRRFPARGPAAPDDLPVSGTARGNPARGVPRRRRVAVPDVRRHARGRADQRRLPDRHRSRPGRPGTSGQRGEVRDDDLRGGSGPAAAGAVWPGVPARPSGRAAHQGRPGLGGGPPGARLRRRRPGGLAAAAAPGAGPQRSAVLEHALEQRRQAAALGRGEGAGHGRQGLCDLRYAAFGEPHSARGEEHVYAAAVVRVGRPPQEAPLLGAVDQAGDGRLIQAEEVRQLAHLDAAVAEDGEHTQLGQREVVLGGDPGQHGHRCERRHDHGVDQFLLAGRGRIGGRIGGCHAQSLLDLVCNHNYSCWYYKLILEVIVKAAVVSAFDTPPSYGDFPDPAPAGDDEIVVDVLAAGLHPRVRSQANGSHYTSTGELPLVPGVDGVGRGSDGLLRYFVLSDTALGSMAERTVIDTRRSIVLPDGTDPVAVAAAMNPAMASWVALRQRVPFRAGQNVLVLGATGNAGQMAVQIAKRLGANQIIAAGRNASRLAALPALGATTTVLLDGDTDGAAGRLGQAAAGVDVVIDYLWGEPAAAAMAAIVTGGAERGPPLSGTRTGAVAGPAAAIPSAALRADRLQIVGSGQGSVSTREILAELPALVQEITTGSFAIDARPTSLTGVEQAWADAARPGQRIVITPQS